MTQKQFVIGLIENEIERDLRQRTTMSEAPTGSEKVTEERTGQKEAAAMSDCENVSSDKSEGLEDEEHGMSIGM